MADEQVRLCEPGSIEKTGWVSVGQGVIDSGIGGVGGGATIVYLLQEIHWLPQDLGTYTLGVLISVATVLFKLARKFFIRYKIVE